MIDPIYMQNKEDKLVSPGSQKIVYVGNLESTRQPIPGSRSIKKYTARPFSQRTVQPLFGKKNQ